MSEWFLRVGRRLGRLVAHLLESVARCVKPLTAVRLLASIVHGHHVVELIGKLDPLSALLRGELTRAAGAASLAMKMKMKGFPFQGETTMQGAKWLCDGKEPPPRCLMKNKSLLG